VAFNPLNAELNPICHLLALLGAHHILHICRIMVKSIILCDARSCYLTGSILLHNQVKHVKNPLFKVKYKLFSNTHFVAWSYLCRNTTSTSTSSRSSWRKSLRKCDTDSYVMCPHTTMCLEQSHTHTNIHKLELHYISVSSKTLQSPKVQQTFIWLSFITHHATCVSIGTLPWNFCSICQLYLCNNAKNAYQFPMSNVTCVSIGTLPQNLCSICQLYLCNNAKNLYQFPMSNVTCVSIDTLPQNFCSICQLYLCNNAKNLYQFPMSNIFHDIKNQNMMCTSFNAKIFKHYEFSTLNNEHFWSSN